MTRPDKSRVGTDAAMRARDVSRPREEPQPDAETLTEAGRRRRERQDESPPSGGTGRRHTGGSRPDSS